MAHQEQQWAQAEQFIADYDLNNGTRNLHMLDMFSVTGMGRDAFVNEGYKAVATDILSHPEHDITSATGFYALLTLLLRLVQGGVVLADPPCSMWIFLSSSYHGRTKASPQGDTSKFKVRLSLQIARNFATMLRLVVGRRGLKVVIEQPHSSVMW